MSETKMFHQSAAQRHETELILFNGYRLYTDNNIQVFIVQNYCTLWSTVTHSEPMVLLMMSVASNNCSSEMMRGGAN